MSEQQQDIGLEPALIGGILQYSLRDAYVAEDVLGIYPPAQWLDSTARAAAEEMQAILEAGERVDFVALALRMSKRVQDGAAWLSEAYGVEAFLTRENMRRTARTLHNQHINRQAAVALQEALHMTTDPLLSPDALEGVLRDCLGRLEGLNGVSASKDDQAAEYFAGLEAGEAQPVPTPWVNLNGALAGGVAPGELVIVGARPSVGKSALAVNWAWHAAALGGNAVVFSLEMSRKQVFDRIAAKLAHVDLRDFRGKMRPEDLARVHVAAPSMTGKRFAVDDRGLLTPAEVRRVCRSRAKLAPLSLVVVDYLQLLTPDNPSHSREQDVSGMSRKLKLLAKDLNVPVVLLSQLNRESEKHGREPILSDLRESGAIEQDADIILFLHSNEADQRAAERFNRPEPLKIIVAKGRSTGKSKVGLQYDKAHQNIFDMTAEDFAALGKTRAQEDNGL